MIFSPQHYRRTTARVRGHIQGFACGFAHRGTSPKEERPPGKACNPVRFNGVTSNCVDKFTKA
jgi:hypothetical protein